MGCLDVVRYYVFSLVTCAACRIFLGISCRDRLMRVVVECMFLAAVLGGFES